MLEEVGYIRLYCTSLQLVPTLSRCKTLFFATVIPFHKLWVMHRRWSYFQMYLSLYWSRQDWLCAWVPKVIWTTLVTRCKSSLSVALWSVAGKPFFPCTYYWLLLAFLGWADGPYLKACSQMVLHTSLYSICLTSIGCGLSLSLIQDASTSVHTWNVFLPFHPYNGLLSSIVEQFCFIHYHNAFHFSNPFCLMDHKSIWLLASDAFCNPMVHIIKLDVV